MEFIKNVLGIRSPSSIFEMTDEDFENERTDIAKFDFFMTIMKLIVATLLTFVLYRLLGGRIWN